MDSQALADAIRRVAADHLMSLTGVADLEPFMRERPAVFADLPRPFPRAVVMALRLSRSVLETCTDGPTPLYFHHYRQANYQLDRAALAVTLTLIREGFDALPVPASQVIGGEGLRGHVSHRALAVQAGLGWRGRNNLLVTPRFGAQVRLVSVLTDAPLPADAPLTAGCGSCRACLAVCPVGAIGESAADFDLPACYRQLCEFRKRRYIGQHICGLCVRACVGFEEEPEPKAEGVQAHG